MDDGLARKLGAEIGKVIGDTHFEGALFSAILWRSLVETLRARETLSDNDLVIMLAFIERAAKEGTLSRNFCTMVANEMRKTWNLPPKKMNGARG